MEVINRTMEDAGFRILSQADKVYLLKRHLAAIQDAVALHEILNMMAFSSSTQSSSPIQATLDRISRAMENVRTGRLAWDKVIILTSNKNNAKESLEYHILNEVSQLYKHTDIEVWARPAHIVDGKALDTGSFDLSLKVIKTLIESGLNPKARVLIILDAGSGSRLYPIVAALVGKGEVAIPHVFEGRPLELTDQVYIQSHMMLEDIPQDKGGFLILANDHLLALGDKMAVTQGIWVYGHDYPMDKVKEELVRLRWLADIAEIVVLDDQGNAIADEEAATTLMNKRIADLTKDESLKAQAPYAFQITQLGHFGEDSIRPGHILTMIEKPKDWQTIKTFFTKAPVANWWDHGYSYDAARKLIPLVEQYKIIGRNMDFSTNFLEAVVRSNDPDSYNAWQKQVDREYRTKNATFAQEEFAFAQAVKATVGRAQLL